MLERCLYKIIVGIIVDFTDIYQLEIGEEVFPKDEEYSI